MNDDIQHTEIHPYEPLDETRLQRFTKLLKTPRVRRPRPTPNRSFTERLAELYKRYRDNERKG